MPVAGVRVGLLDGKLVVNPTIQEMEKSKLDMVIAGTSDAVLMIEASDFINLEIINWTLHVCLYNKAGCPKKKRKYVTKKNYGKVPAYLANRIASAAKKKKRESPEEMAKCNHEGTRKYDSIHSVFTTTHSWSIFSQTILNGK